MSAEYADDVVPPTFVTVYVVVPVDDFVSFTLTFSFVQTFSSFVCGFVFIAGITSLLVTSVKSNFPIVNSFVVASIVVVVVFPALSITIISTLYFVLSFNFSNFPVVFVEISVSFSSFNLYVTDLTPLSLSLAFAVTVIVFVVVDFTGETVGAVLSTNT